METAVEMAPRIQLPIESSTGRHLNVGLVWGPSGEILAIWGRAQAFSVYHLCAWLEVKRLRVAGSVADLKANRGGVMSAEDIPWIAARPGTSLPEPWMPSR